MIHDVHEKYDFKGQWDAYPYGKESTERPRPRTANVREAVRTFLRS